VRACVRVKTGDTSYTVCMTFFMQMYFLTVPVCVNKIHVSCWQLR